MDFWTLIVMSTCLLTSVQVLGCLLVSTMFLIDTWRTTHWEHLDDAVYYARASIRVLEFLDALFFVAAGIYESIDGTWGFMNSFILFVHAYFNVWYRLQSGWKSFLQRQQALKKVKSLPEATKEQIAEYNDVCAVCYSDLESARITPCGHFYHTACLHKWLFVQDTCPMCHQDIFKQTQTKKDTGTGQQEVHSTGIPENTEGEIHPTIIEQRVN